MWLCNISLFDIFHYCLAIRVNSDLIDLNGVTEPLSASHWIPKLPLKLRDLSAVQMLDFFHHGDFMHHLLPLEFIIYSEIYFEQVLHRIKDRTIQHVFVVVLHHIVLENWWEMIFSSIGRPRMPFSEPMLRESHLSAILPSHCQFITSAEELIVERWWTSLHQSECTLRGD
jgi:hypothetical protein